MSSQNFPESLFRTADSTCNKWIETIPASQLPTCMFWLSNHQGKIFGIGTTPLFLSIYTKELSTFENVQNWIICVSNETWLKAADLHQNELHPDEAEIRNYLQRIQSIRTHDDHYMKLPNAVRQFRPQELDYFIFAIVQPKQKNCFVDLIAYGDDSTHAQGIMKQGVSTKVERDTLNQSYCTLGHLEIRNHHLDWFLANFSPRRRASADQRNDHKIFLRGIMTHLLQVVTRRRGIFCPWMCSDMNNQTRMLTLNADGQLETETGDDQPLNIRKLAHYYSTLGFQLKNEGYKVQNISTEQDYAEPMFHPDIDTFPDPLTPFTHTKNKLFETPIIIVDILSTETNSDDDDVTFTHQYHNTGSIRLVSTTMNDNTRLNEFENYHH